MPHRILLSLTLLLSAGLGSVVAAATLDPELADLLQNKTDAEPIPILLILQDSGALPVSEETADRSGRRRQVVTGLKQRASLSQQKVLALLRRGQESGEVGPIRSLWLINAVVFRGSAEVVRSVAETDIPAILLHDKAFPMAGGGSRMSPQPNRSALGATARSDTAWGIGWIGADRVWQQTGLTGEGVLVAHFDTGAWLTHPDLADRLWVNPGEIPDNGLDDDGNGYTDDIHGFDFANRDGDPNDDVSGSSANHGTHTAGTVCGDGTGGTVTGVAPGASLMVCKVFFSNGIGAPLSALYEAQQYALEMGAQVFTMSIGIAGNLAPVYLRLDRQNVETFRSAGIVLFTSAGNEHLQFSVPHELFLTARVPSPWVAGAPYGSRGGAITVGGTGYQDHTVNPQSSQGPAAWGDVPPWYDWPFDPGPGLIKPDLAAPGTNVNSLLKPDGYSGDTWSGTSMACPHAAGVAALMLQKNPSLSPAGVDSILQQTAVDLGDPGKDNVFGSGMLDALAAVMAVPEAPTPHLLLVRSELDPTGDGVLDPAEEVVLIVELINNSTHIDATETRATLTAASDPHVTVTDASGSFADIPRQGGHAENLEDVFLIAAGPGATDRHRFTLTLLVEAQNGYRKEFEFELQIGLPDWRTHRVGSVGLTVTDRGTVGYLDADRIFGLGFGPTGQPSGLNLGSLWGGNHPGYICNNGFGAVGPDPVDPAEWVVRSEPDGRVQSLATSQADQTFEACFSDSGHATPQPVEVLQRSFAWADPPNDDFVLLTYLVRNGGSTSLSDYYLGLFCDFDVGGFLGGNSNEGARDLARKLAFLSYGDDYYGIALLGDTPVRNATVVHNPTYLRPEGYIEDVYKLLFLKGIITNPATTAPDDWGVLTSAGPFDLAPGDSLRIAFALLYAGSLDGLMDAADRANEALATTSVPGPFPARTVLLRQNQPNPFNPMTSIEFVVPTADHVTLAVFDLSGRRIKTLADSAFGPGRATVTWDGTDDHGLGVASGLYLYRLAVGGRLLSRKMMLIR